MIGTSIGPYEIIRELSANWFGHSYEALDHAHGNKVLIIACLPEYVTVEVIERLQAEARTIALLSHPNVARTLGFVRRDQRVYLITEFFEGHTLEQILSERATMPPAMAVNLFRQVFAGVAAAHRLGVVHGDLRPSNVLVPNFGPVKILNFGISHLLDNTAHADRNDVRYLAPEQIAGEPPDTRSDIYSLGLMLYESIIGKGPFDSYGPCDGLAASRTQLIPVPPSLLLSEMPDWLHHAVLQMLSPDPSGRYDSVKSILRVLDAHSESDGSQLDHEIDGNSQAAILKSPIPSKKTVSGGFKARIKPARLGEKIQRALAPRAFNKTLYSAMSGVSVSRSAALTRLKQFSQASNWKRYANATALLLLIAAESFYFRGANLSLLLDLGRPQPPSLNDSVDAMFARLNAKASTSSPEVLRNEPLRPVEEPPSRYTRPLVLPKPTAVKRPEPMQNISVNRQPSALITEPTLNREPEEAVIDRSKANERNDLDAVRTAHSNTAKSQLSVKWEN